MATTTKTPVKKPAARKPAAKKPVAKKAAAPRVAAVKQTPVQKAAERAVHVPLGATLVASDVVGETVDTLRSTLTSTDALTKELQLRRKRFEAEVQRFERRGATARTRIEKDLKGRRTQLEKDLKARRTSIEKDLKARRGSADELVQNGLEFGQQAVTRVQERVAAIR